VEALSQRNNKIEVHNSNYNKNVFNKNVL